MNTDEQLMTDEQANLITRYIQEFDGHLGRMEEKLDHLTLRVASVETKIVALERSIVDIHGDTAGINARLDTFGRHLERIERRLELSDEKP